MDGIRIHGYGLDIVIAGIELSAYLSVYLILFWCVIVFWFPCWVLALVTQQLIEKEGLAFSGAPQNIKTHNRGVYTKQQKVHTTPGIRWWSPTQLLVWWSYRLQIRMKMWKRGGEGVF